MASQCLTSTGFSILFCTIFSSKTKLGLQLYSCFFFFFLQEKNLYTNVFWYLLIEIFTLLYINSVTICKRIYFLPFLNLLFRSNFSLDLNFFKIKDSHTHTHTKCKAHSVSRGQEFTTGYQGWNGYKLQIGRRLGQHCWPEADKTGGGGEQPAEH